MNQHSDAENSNEDSQQDENRYIAQRREKLTAVTEHRDRLTQTSLSGCILPRSYCSNTRNLSREELDDRSDRSQSCGAHDVQAGYG